MDGRVYHESVLQIAPLSQPALIFVRPVTGFHVVSVHSIVVLFAMVRTRSIEVASL
jgi:hypothetical protein